MKTSTAKERFAYLMYNRPPAGRIKTKSEPTRHTFDIPDGVKKITILQEGNMNKIKELTDFYMWMQENDYDHNIRARVERKAEMYLNNIKTKQKYLKHSAEMENTEYRIVDNEGNEVLADVSISLLEFIEEVKYMIDLYGAGRYTQAEQIRDELAEKLDDIMRFSNER